MLDLQFSSTLTLENLSAHSVAIDHALQDSLSKCTAELAQLREMMRFFLLSLLIK
jgi:hypothetical protein